jgi:amino acid adenylation domain-containing protein
MLVGLLGILKAGGAYVPLNPEHPKSRLSRQLAEVEAPILITQQKVLGQLPDFNGAVITLDTDAALWEREPETNPDRITTSQHLVYVMFTSGSTGTPKGAAINHESLVNYTHFICQMLGIEHTSASARLNFATVSTIGADLGNTCIFPSLASGGCLHIISYDRATEATLLADYFSRHSIDVLKIVPSHLSALLTADEDVSVLPKKYLILGGEALSLDLAKRVLNLAGKKCEVINHYGPTETTIGSLTYNLSENGFHRQALASVPIGCPVANTETYVLDQHLKPVPVGVPGELYIGGKGLARAYLNQPEQTAERFVPHPFSTDSGARLYMTGDLVRYLSDGNIEYIGRVDHQLKIRGFRVELGEIEATLAGHPKVRQSVVVGWENAPGDVRLAAYVVPSLQPWPTVDELREFLKIELPDYMIPSAFVMLKTLPLTRNGKVDRHALPSPEQAQSESVRTFVAPRNPIEESLSKVWAEVLNLEQVSVDDNFFSLGGHSLLVTQVISRIRKMFQVELPLRCLFESPTIAELAERIQLAEDEAAAHLLVELEGLSDEEVQELLQLEKRE